MITRNGTPCIHTGPDGTPRRFTRMEDNTTFPDNTGDFVRVQILPPVPQRFELVRSDNLRKENEREEV